MGVFQKSPATFLKGIGLALFLACVVLASLTDDFRFDSEKVVTWLDSAGAAAPAFLIGLTAGAIVISPIPGVPLNMAAGLYFGPIQGTLYAWAGGLLGAVASFLIARFFGRGLIERLLGGHVHFCTQCSNRLLTKIVLVSRLLPFISFDIVSYGSGLTKMSIGRFSLATAIGMLPATFGTTYFGYLIRVNAFVMTIGALIMVVLFFALPRWIEKYNFLGLRRYIDHGPERRLS